VQTLNYTLQGGGDLNDAQETFIVFVALILIVVLAVILLA